MATNKSKMVHSPRAVLAGSPEGIKMQAIMDNFVDVYRLLNDIQVQLDELKNK